jgi:hypothetical protein
MGVSVHYWAIPPQSRLYARLQVDRGFYMLMAYMFPYGCGIYRFSEVDPQEREEIIEDVIQWGQAVLGPEPEARRRVAELLAELERTRGEFPGVEQRTAMLEKCSSAIEERLTQELKTVRTDAAEFTHRVMFGDKDFARHLGLQLDDSLGWVPLPVVREGAAALERLRPEELFPGSARWDRDNYKPWRQLYLEAARHGEELLFGFS